MLEKKFKKKYRIPSSRLPGHDYGGNGYYFITICTKNKKPFFGQIKKNKMEYSVIGKITDNFWNKIPIHFDFVLLDEWIIMPDHIHGVIIINNNQRMVEMRHNLVETHNYASLQVREMKFSGNTFGPQSKNLGSIIRAFKIAVQTYANQNNITFAWQPRYYDRIIRNERELNNVRRYIRNNPRMWHNQDI